MRNALIEACLSWFRPKEREAILQKLEKLDTQQGEIRSDLEQIRAHVDPLATLIRGLREPPDGWDVRKRKVR